MTKDLLTLLDFPKEEILQFIDLAARFKADLRRGGNAQSLSGKVVVLIFEKPSLRTRVTFETGIVHLGGHPIHLAPDTIQIGQRESAPDVGKNLERWVNGIVARTFSQKLLTELARNCSVPVINALSDDFHPCQALATGLTIKEHFGRLEGLNVAFVGDGNNVARSLFVLCAKLGINATLVCPEGYDIEKAVMERILYIAKQTGSKIGTVHNPKEGVRNADLVYTDVWASMGQEREAKKRKKAFSPFQVNAGLISNAKKGCKISHCLPAHRGEEITDEVLDGPDSIMFDEAENRLHVQKAVLHLLFGKKEGDAS